MSKFRSATGRDYIVRDSFTEAPEMRQSARKYTLLPNIRTLKLDLHCPSRKHVKVEVGDGEKLCFAGVVYRGSGDSAVRP